MFLKLRQIEATLDFPSSTFLMKILCYKPLAVFIKSTYNILFIGKIIHKFITILGLMTAEISQIEKEENMILILKKYPNAIAKLLLVQLNKFEAMREQRGIISELYSKSFDVRRLM